MSEITKKILVDGNWKPTGIHAAGIVAHQLTLAAGDVTANQWERILPSGAAATISTTNRRSIALGALRSDVQNSDFTTGWRLFILEAGYEQTLEIESLDATGACVLKEDIRFYNGGLPKSNVAFTLVPEILLGLNIANAPAGNNVDIGIAKAGNSTSLNVVATLRPRDRVCIPSGLADRVWYRFGTAAAQILIWGEHKVDFFG